MATMRRQRASLLGHTCNAYCREERHALAAWASPDPEEAREDLGRATLAYGWRVVTLNPAPELPPASHGYADGHRGRLRPIPPMMTGYIIIIEPEEVTS